MSNTDEFYKACEYYETLINWVRTHPNASCKAYTQAKYYEALINWVRTHPNASCKVYTQARDKLRKEFDVEFIEDWRKEE